MNCSYWNTFVQIGWFWNWYAAQSNIFFASLINFEKRRQFLINFRVKFTLVYHFYSILYQFCSILIVAILPVLQVRFLF